MNGFCAVINHRKDKLVNKSMLNAMLDPLLYSDIGKIKIQLYKGIGFGVYDHFYAKPERLIYKDEHLFVVCDAEIYNFKDVSAYKNFDELYEAKIIADLYSKNGIYWYKDVQGVFSAFIWDFKKNQGYAYTDRIGTKPVRHYQDGDTIVIASSIKSIAALPGFKKELDHQAIFSYISMEMIPTPYTVYKNVKKLESGFVLTVSENRLDTKMIWQMTYPEDKITDPDEGNHPAQSRGKRVIR